MAAARSRRKTSPRPSGRRWWAVLLWLAFELFIWGSLVAVVAGGFYAFSVDQELTAKFEGKRWKLPSQVYSDTLTITPEMKLTTSGVVDRLKRLNYHEVTEEPKQAGEYRAQATALEIFQRRFDYPGEMVKPRLVRVTLNGDRVGKLLDVTERKDLTMLDIEPELIGRFFGQVQEVRRIIPWADIPKSLVWSVVAVEDAGFFHHHGINVRGVLRATLKAAIHLKAREGGSSITQQLVKNFYLTPERTVLRKLKEMVMAVVLEMFALPTPRPARISVFWRSMGSSWSKMRAASNPCAANTSKAAVRISSWRCSFRSRRRGEDLAAFPRLEFVPLMAFSTT